jgi:pyrroline-5-carboxylate reductase
MSSSLISKKIVFIGGGNIAHSLAQGLILGGVSANSIKFSSSGKDQEKLTRFAALNVQRLSSNIEAATNADILILAVKPNILRHVCEEIAETMQVNKPVVISLVAGIGLKNIYQWLNTSQLPIIRTMTNIAMSIGKGATNLVPNQFVTDEQAKLIEELFQIVGIYYWVNNEQDLNKQTPLFGSTMASFYFIIQAMVEAAIAQGVPPEKAIEVTLQTLAAAIDLLQKKNSSPEQLRAEITTPNGITHALNQRIKPIFNLYEKGYSDAVTKGDDIEKHWQEQTKLKPTSPI